MEAMYSVAKSQALKLTLLTIIATFVALDLSAQSWVLEESFGGASDDFGYNGVTTSDGGHVHIGRTESLGAANTMPNVHVVRVNPLGVPLWERVYDVLMVNPEMSIVELASGDLAWTCGVRMPQQNRSDILVVRTDPQGVALWARLIGFGNGKNERSASIIEAANGDIIVAGYTTATGAGDALVLRLSATGISLWTRSYGGASSLENARCIREATNGDLIVAGGIGSGANLDGLMFRINNTGNTLVWSHAYGGATTMDNLATLVLDNANNEVYACGVWDDGPNSDSYVVRANALSGVQIAAETYSSGFPGKEGATYIALSGTPGNYVLTGQTGEPNGSSVLDVFAMEITGALGAPLWFRIFGNTPVQTDDVGRSINFTPNGNADAPTQGGYWILGYTYTFGAGGADEYLIRCNLVGNSGCSRILPVVNTVQSPHTALNLVSQLFSPPIAVTISSAAANAQTVICPGQYVGTAQAKHSSEWESIDVPLAHSIDVYPNPLPAESSLVLDVFVPRAGKANITLADIHGRELLDIQKDLRQGLNSISLAIGKRAAGLYSLRVRGAGIVQSTTVSLID